MDMLYNFGQGGKCARTLVDCILVKVEIADTSEKSLTEEEERSKGMHLYSKHDCTAGYIPIIDR